MEESTIILVGHGHYFKKMLCLDDYVHNCDVWKGQFCYSSTDKDVVQVEWKEFSLQHRSSLSYQHPINHLFSRINQERDVNNINEVKDEKDDDNEDDDISCRICQMTASESSPEEVFIRPCKCSGTLSHVHISCLNEWRATSSTASYQCSVCHYTYRIERTWLSQFLMCERGTDIISILMITLGTVLAGIAGITVTRSYFSFDVCWRICQLAHWRMWWRHCSFYRLPIKVETLLNFITSFLFKCQFIDMQTLLLCRPGTVVMIEVLLVGCVILGLLGFVIFIINESYQVYQSMRRGENINTQYIATVVCWVASLSSTDIGRLSVWLGFAVSCRASYYQIRKVGKKVGQTIGERILEPNN